MQTGGAKGSMNHVSISLLKWASIVLSLFITSSVREILLAFFVCASSNSYIHSLLIPEN